MATRFQMWKQAIADLERAIAELGQVQVSLVAIDMDDLDCGDSHTVTANDLLSGARELLTELRDAECEDCGHAIAKHGDKYGCEYDRGDVQMNTRDGGTVLAAAGPCACRWGLVEASHVQ